jgi:Calx-beta domain/Right handed beta helix region/Divergent InlB B-repeat domain/Pectate lyase
VSPRRTDRPVAFPIAVLTVAGLGILTASSAALAFEGYGYQTVGGAGGTTCRVTRLTATGAGSFADCVENRTGPRIIVFDVGGTITLSQTLFIVDPYLTIDGTTAPAPGITVRPQDSSTTALAIENTHDIIVKGIRMKGYGTENGADLLRIDGDVGEVYNIVADHLTLLSADDGAMDITSNARDITVSWCLFSGTELTQLIKYGVQRRISLHHNVYANLAAKGERNPLAWGDLTDLDYVNNIVHGWFFHGLMVRHEGDVGNSGRVHANIVNNLFSHDENATIEDALIYGTQPGPDAVDGGPSGTPAQGTVVTTTRMGRLWVSGNILPPQNRDHYSTVSSPLAVPAPARVTTWPASELPSRVLPSVGTGHRTSAEQALLDVVGAGALPVTHVLNVAKAGTGDGTVTSSPNGINCGGDCSHFYNPGTVVTLNKVAAAGSTFTGWSGACTGAGACQVTMSAVKSVTATFTLNSALPALSITGATVGEGDAGYQVVLLRVSLSTPSSVPVTVAYWTSNDTARAGRDYLRASGTLVLPEGTSAGELALWVSGDQLTEATETFTVNLARPENANIATGTATVTIVDNDVTLALAMADVVVTEGHGTPRNAVFRVTLSAPTPADVAVDWTTSDLTARAGEDYVASGGTLTIPRGRRMGSVMVPVLGDRVDERNEAFLLRLSNAAGARIIDDRAQGVIWDDDGAKDNAIPIASLPYVVTRPRHYRLVGDLAFNPARGAAVTVAASGVVLDLDGHTLSGSGGAATEAFGVLARNRSKITVQNGRIQGFLAGVFLAGPHAVASKFAVRNLRVHSSTYAGVWLEGRGNQVDACEVVDTGGTTALDPGAGAVGISSVGATPKLTQNQIRNTVAPSGGHAFAIAADRATRGLFSGNLVSNSSSGPATGLLVTRASRTTITLNTFDTLDYGIVFTGDARVSCTGNSMVSVATPTVGLTCEP